MNNEEKLICKICNEKFNSLKTTTIHILKIHNLNSKQYYDNHFLRKKDIDEGICLTCGKETNFIGPTSGYHKFCSTKCSTNNKKVQEKWKQSCQNHYGVSHPMKCKEVQEKGEETCFKNYKVRHPYQSKEILETYIQTSQKNCGKDHHMQSKNGLENFKQKFFEKYGVENPYQLEEAREKGKQTNLIKRGIDNIFKDNEYIKKCRFKKWGVDHWSKTDEGRHFHSEKILVQIAWQRNNGKPIFPKIGKKEGPFFDKAELKLGIKFIRQDRVAGKWSDGRPEPFWIRLRTEYNEKDHYNADGILKTHYINREARIAAKGFIIYNIKESDCDINEDLEIEKLGKFIEMLKEEYQSDLTTPKDIVI